MRLIKKRMWNIIFLALSIILISAGILCIIFVDNKNVEYEKIYINTRASSLGAVKIAHLSDLHFPNIDVDTDSIVKNLDEQGVNIVAITGDLISRKSDVKSCGVLEFIGKLAQVSQIYYVNGNHEFDNPNSEELYKQLNILGVSVLQDKSTTINVKGNSIKIMGLFEDSNFDDVFEKDNNDTSYKILLAHHPEKWEQYCASSYVDLILSGHAHGGQARIFGKGIIAPNQGFFPQYSSGLYQLDNAKMVVSRGLGNSFFPWRFNNKPHIPIIELNSN